MSRISVHTIMVPWDDIFAVLRRAAPKLGKYGEDVGGDTAKMLAMVRNDALIERVAKGLWDLQTTRNVATKDATPRIKKALDDYASGVAELANIAREFQE